MLSGMRYCSDALVGESGFRLNEGLVAVGDCALAVGDCALAVGDVRFIESDFCIKAAGPSNSRASSSRFFMFPALKELAAGSCRDEAVRFGAMGASFGTISFLCLKLLLVVGPPAADKAVVFL
eukprot:2822983-Rhodomonas_salina.5